MKGFISATTFEGRAILIVASQITDIQVYSGIHTSIGIAGSMRITIKATFEETKSKLLELAKADNPNSILELKSE